MFRSKKDVDAHVRDIFSKCKSETERLQLCFGIAKQYSRIREFESARRYVETYINSNPFNVAEAHKLMGDIQLELGSHEKALESYKLSFNEDNSREALNRVCDLLAQGFGESETAESKKKWLDMQKSTGISTPTSSASSRPKIKSHPSPFTNGNTNPILSNYYMSSPTITPNGNSVELKIRHLERRLDDGLGKMLDQGSQILEQLQQMLEIKKDMKDLADKVDHVATNQEHMMGEMRDLKEKHKETQKLALENQKVLQAMQKMRLTESRIEQPPPASTFQNPAMALAPQNLSTRDSASVLEYTTPRKSEESKEPVYSHTPINLSGRLNTEFAISNNPPPSIPVVNTTTFGGVVAPAFSSLSSLNKNTEEKKAIITSTPASNFNFGFTAANVSPAAPASVPLTSAVDGGSTKKPEEELQSAFPGLNLSGKFSFADLAKTNNTSSPSFSFPSVAGTQAFSGVGAPLFSSLPSANTAASEKPVNTSVNLEEGEDDFVPTAEFQPVIPLPPLVEVKKGDENENTIAEYRAKLYRFIAETKEWKERGVGNVKLLQSKSDAKKCRVVMWREKVGKLACNFNLFPDIKVTNYQNNPKVLCWKCQDFTEEPAWETFTLRFGNEDNCAHFKTEMERLATLTVAATESSPSSAAKVSSPAAAPKNSEAKQVQVPLSELFKKPEGSWNCNACYCTNASEATSCVACQTCRPGYEQVPTATEALPEISQPKFSFGFPAANTAAPTFNFGFGNSISSTTQQTAVTTDNVAPSVETVEPKKAEDEAAPAFPGLNLSGKFSFADLAKNSPSSTPSFSFASSTPTDNQAFSGAGAPLFSSLTPASNATVDKTANTSGTAEDGGGEDDFVPTAEFQPVIPLPPLVEVKKGDEDENTVAEYRAKLYRFIAETKEWKERGVGNVKLLQLKTDPKKCRVVMWREKVGKLACNFNLFPDIKVTNYQNNPKVLCWKCQDFAEEPAWETFTLRFGNEDNCAHFKTEMERLATLTVAATESSPSSAAKVSSPATASNGGDKQVPLSELFKKPEGSWNCNACYCSNASEATSCVACQTCRPGYEQAPKATEAQPEISQPKFSFGFPAANTAAPTFNFGFGNNNTSSTVPSAIVTTTTVDGVAPKEPKATKESAFPGLNLSGKFSFADLAKNNNSTSTFSFASTTTSNQTFNGAGAPLFSALSSANSSVVERTANTSGTAEDGGGEDDFVPTAEFQPVIPLPPLVEVKKGDEDENTVAEYRAKLYRFIAETKEWKERGVGNVKLLQSKTDAAKCRVVMWREKIGKLACNFSLFPDFKVTNYQNNQKVLCWKCQDYAEEPAWETFTLRFGNEDNCAHFKSEMERLAKLTVIGGENSPSGVKKEPVSVLPPNNGVKEVPLSQLFKKPEGSWNCDACYCSNSSAATLCISCQTLRPGSTQVAPPELVKIENSEEEEERSTCPGCAGCNPDTYQIPEVKKSSVEDIIELPLSLDSSSELPPLGAVNLSMFTKPIEVAVNRSPVVNTVAESQSIGSADSNQDPNKSNSLSNFSFSFQTPEKSSPISFQFKTPTFSVKPEDNSSIFGGGGSIFTPPAGGNPPGGTPSPFVSPFGQQSSLLNNSGSPHSVSFGFSQPLFNQQQPAVQSPSNEDVPEQREEDEYEDVDDEEEDECMFEEDAHVYIQDDADSSENFSDKGDCVVRVLYDGESYCARLVVMVDGETIAEHLVAVETILEPKGDLTFEWSGICNYESPVKSRIRAVFNDDDACKSFSNVMGDSLEFAEQAGITEAVLLDETSGGY